MGTIDASGLNQIAVVPIGLDGEALNVPLGAPSISTEQEALSTTAEAALAARTNRRYVIVQNLDAAETVWVGSDTNTAPTTGIRLLPGESVRLDTTAAIWCEAGANTPTVAFLEVYG